MGRLEELIQQLCPDGVEYKKLDAIANISRGGNFQKKDYVENGFPCIHYGQIYTKYNLFVNDVSSYISPQNAEKQKKAVHGDIVMAVTSENIEDVCKCVAWLGNGEIAVSGHIAIIHHKLEPKYLVYYLNSSLFFRQKLKLVQGTKVMEVSPEKLKKVMPPVPPLEVQREIVRILDQFTGLTAELTAELTARKKQYEYYRDSLLTFNNSFPLVTLSDLCDIGDGLHGTPKYDNNGEYYFINGNNLSNGKIVFDTKTKRISQFEYEKIQIKFDQTLLFSINGTIGNIAIYNNEKVALGKSIAYFNIVSNRLLLKYLFYVLQTHQSMIYFEKNLTGSTIKNLGLKILRDYQICLPPTKIQKKIVAILDRFDTLCNDLTSGLPAEIEARRKQYEYYRDKLLTFKDISQR